ncbi:DUF1722 domain-containing protein [Candidatus Izemoplasma sp. B36]|uniref:DUF1722 domain-containing protein n=1 Tax=Candidatus Izemoplasma sp. B36 TaxID=3242468 RepID=UPI003557EA14
MLNPNKMNFNTIEEKENYLINIYSRARFALIKNKSVKHLIKYHETHKYLFMTINKNILSEMGILLANTNKSNIYLLYQAYYLLLLKLFKNPFSKRNRINTLEHMYGYFKYLITEEEKSKYFEAQENYRLGKIAFSIPLNMIKEFAIKFNQTYILDQVIFEPYPKSIIL